jgi:ketosteroid isomerase-like protein
VTDDDVLRANAEFYAAFEARDLDKMADVWERSDRASVTHPGWPRLSGWAKIAGSWEAIFHNTAYIQFVLTDEQVTVVGDLAVVTVDENILQSNGPGEGDDGASNMGDDLSGARIAATNVFVRDGARDGDRWRMLSHHGSPVAEG